MLWSLPATRTHARTSRPTPQLTSVPTLVDPASSAGATPAPGRGAGRVLPPLTWQSRREAGAAMEPRGWRGRYQGPGASAALPRGMGGGAGHRGAERARSRLAHWPAAPAPPRGALRRSAPAAQGLGWKGPPQWERPPPHQTPSLGHRARGRSTPARGLLPAGGPVGDSTVESLGRQGNPRAATTFKLFRVPS